MRTFHPVCVPWQAPVKNKTLQSFPKLGHWGFNLTVFGFSGELLLTHALWVDPMHLPASEPSVRLCRSIHLPCRRFMCALHPSLRNDWARTWNKVVKCGGYLIALEYPIRPDDKTGPPWPVSPQIYADLLMPLGRSPLTQKLDARFCRPYSAPSQQTRIGS